MVTTRGYRRLWAVIGAVAALLALPACGGNQVHAPVISVVTTIYPLAQAVSAIGGSTVSVVDLATPGVDPRTQTLTAAQAGELRRAAVVFDVGAGFQPSVEQTVATARSVVSLAPRFGPAAGGAWLNPALMGQDATVIARALTAANPAAASAYSTSAQDFSEQLASSGIDYQTGLGDCAKHDVAAPDGTLSALAAQYRLTLHQLGTSPAPTAAETATAAATIASNGITTVFSEPWVSDATVKAAARHSGTKVRAFDTLEAPPAGGWPRGSTYLSLLASDLGTLTSALVCQTNTGQ
ncbi:MAG: metal ABC transporter substrate-binding protein [Actinomycetota bacterium]|nr:metal ABC transporter substrate-binding protein [Actinomycetota bacterium]